MGANVAPAYRTDNYVLYSVPLALGVHNVRKAPDLPLDPMPYNERAIRGLYLVQCRRVMVRRYAPRYGVQRGHKTSKA